MKSSVNMGLRLNYGMQRFYRDNGIEPCCGICRHFLGAAENLDTGYRFCPKQNQYTRDADVCYSPERAPGSEGDG